MSCHDWDLFPETIAMSHYTVFLRCVNTGRLVEIQPPLLESTYFAEILGLSTVTHIGCVNSSTQEEYYSQVLRDTFIAAP